MLEQEIESRRKEIHTDSYPMSIGEIINLYQDGELDIHPEFQRMYRWNDIQKTRLIESILLGIPLPSFFVAQRDDGVWDVVDGLQRLATIFSFLGIYQNENNELESPLTLCATEYLPSLEGKVWSEKLGSNHFSIDLQRAFKREKIDLKIIKKESDGSKKYELFQRLNTFGSSLSDQEVRNCLLLMTNKSIYEWLKNLSDDNNFIETIPLTERQIEEQYRTELAVRFFVLKNCTANDVKNLPNVGDFLTKKLKEIANDTNFNQANEAEKFTKTFSLLKKALGEDSFKKYSTTRLKYYSGAFSLSVYEVMAIGLGKHIDSYDLSNELHIQKVKQISEELQSNSIYQNASGSGSNAEKRLPKLLPLGEELFRL